MTHRLLDLFCGAGGAGVGYARAGFEVIGVDHRPQPHYPFECVCADAIEFVTQHGNEFDAIHASPPCQAYTGLRHVTLSRFGHAPDHPDLIAVTRAALVATGRVYVIENVRGAPLRTTVILHGVMFGLPHLWRARHFESNVLLLAPPGPRRVAGYTIGVYGSRPDGRRVSYRHHRPSRVANSLAEARVAMGIDWMGWDEITQAVPPAYTDYIGQQLITYLERCES